MRSETFLLTFSQDSYFSAVCRSMNGESIDTMTNVLETGRTSRKLAGSIGVIYSGCNGGANAPPILGKPAFHGKQNSGEFIIPRAVFPLLPMLLAKLRLWPGGRLSLNFLLRMTSSPNTASLLAKFHVIRPHIAAAQMSLRPTSGQGV